MWLSGRYNSAVLINPTGGKKKSREDVTSTKRVAKPFWHTNRRQCDRRRRSRRSQHVSAISEDEKNSSPRPSNPNTNCPQWEFIPIKVVKKEKEPVAGLIGEINEALGNDISPFRAALSFFLSHVVIFLLKTADLFGFGLSGSRVCCQYDCQETKD